MKAGFLTQRAQNASSLSERMCLRMKRPPPAAPAIAVGRRRARKSRPGAGPGIPSRSSRAAGPADRHVDDPLHPCRNRPGCRSSRGRAIPSQIPEIDEGDRIRNGHKTGIPNLKNTASGPTLSCKNLYFAAPTKAASSTDCRSFTGDETFLIDTRPTRFSIRLSRSYLNTRV